MYIGRAHPGKSIYKVKQSGFNVSSAYVLKSDMECSFPVDAVLVFPKRYYPYVHVSVFVPRHRNLLLSEINCMLEVSLVPRPSKELEV